MADLKSVLNDHIVRANRLAEHRLKRGEECERQWDADCRSLDALCDDLRQLSPLVSVAAKLSRWRYDVAVSVHQFRPAYKPREILKVEVALVMKHSHEPGSDFRSAGTFITFPVLRSHVEQSVLKAVATAIGRLGVRDLKTYNDGYAAGKRWAISCEPIERRSFWKARRELTDSDAESVFEAIWRLKDHDGLDEAEWQNRYEEFWGIEELEDPPYPDFVKGFVAGALSIISQVHQDRMHGGSRL